MYLKIMNYPINRNEKIAKILGNIFNEISLILNLLIRKTLTDRPSCRILASICLSYGPPYFSLATPH